MRVGRSRVVNPFWERGNTLFQKSYLVLWLAWCFLLFASCQQHGPGGQPPPETVSAFEKRYTDGGLGLVVQADRLEMTVADRLTVIMKATVPEEYLLNGPDRQEKLGEFTLVSLQQHPPELAADGTVMIRLQLVLEPFLAGEYTIPSIVVSAGPKSGTNEPLYEVITEEIPIKVHSLHEKSEAPALEDIAPPVDKPLNRLVVAAVIVTIFLFCCLALFLLRRRKSAIQRYAAPPVPPHIIALQALEKVLGENLPAKGELKRFHTEISDILRHYIENRFGLKAPEKTTEEFLTELGGPVRSGAIAETGSSRETVFHYEHKRLLKEFLTQCDLVKFAEYRPSPAESEQVVVLCRQFIQETKPRAES